MKLASEYRRSLGLRMMIVLVAALILTAVTIAYWLSQVYP